MNSYYAMLALDLADDRAREARERRLARLAREGQMDSPPSFDGGLPEPPQPSVWALQP